MDRLSSYVRASGAGGSTILASTTYAYMPTAQSLRMSDLQAGTSMWTMHDFAGVSTRYTQTGTGALTLWSSFLNNTNMWECHILARIDTLPAAANVYNLQDFGCHDPVTGAAGSQTGIPLPTAPQWPQGNTCCPTLPTSPDINHWIGYHAGNPTGTYESPQETGSGGPTPPASPSKSNITIYANASLGDAGLGHRITPEATNTVTVGGSINYANRGNDGLQEPGAVKQPCEDAPALLKKMIAEWKQPHGKRGDLTEGKGGEKEKVQKQIERAKERVNKAIEALDNPSDNSGKIDDMFGKGTSTNAGSLGKLKKNYEEIKKTLEDPDYIKRIKKGSGSNRADTWGIATSTCGQVVRHPDWYTELTEEFFKQDPDGDYWTQSGILVHEASHAAIDTTDYKKDPGASKEDRMKGAKHLGEKEPDKARKAADNHAFFAESVSGK